MPSGNDPVLPSRRGVSIRRRLISFVLALAAEILVVIGLLTLAPHPPPPKKAEPRPTLFDFTPSPQPKDAPKKAPSRVASTKPKAGGGASAAPRAPNPPTTPEPPPPINPWLNDKSLFDAADIAKLPTHSGNTSIGAGADSAGPDSGSAYGPGEGPGGERLYNAEWYVEPTDAELKTYMPATVPPGSWATIACKTIANYHVENCRSLSESPVGSGLARGMRLAAWQFRVRPPRIGGHALIGAWVRIRIDFTEHPGK